MEEKSLKQILEFDDVVIPEIQREYVWGNNKRVLNQFIIDLKNNSLTNIGFVYSYRPYSELNEIFLIDGQQRITTLVLIAFYFAVKEKNLKEFNKLMRLDESKTAFSYRVRSCTKEFLLELFNNIEILEDLRSLDKQKWFLDRYKTDMSISSMKNAIAIIDENLKDCDDLYDIIVNDIKFWYFNVAQTSQGEELYITMNSRGESLSDAEQIKPLLFEQIKSAGDKQKYGKLWDEIEEYFYEKKPSNEGIEVVDRMMNRFIQLILQLENATEKNIDGTTNARFSPEEIQNIDLEKIKYYFEALKIIDNNKRLKEKEETSLLACFYEKTQKEIYLYPLASLMKAVYLIVKNDTTQSQDSLSENLELLRLYKVIRNAVRRGTINYVPLLRLLSDYKGEVYKFFLDYHEKNSEKELQVLSKHELDKIRIIFESDSKEDIEEAFWEAQESLDYLLGGSLKPLIKPFQNIENWTDETLKTFIKREKMVSELFREDIIKKPLSIEPKNGVLDNSLIARALLTIEDHSYHTGGNNYCYGYGDYWKSIFKEEKGWQILSKMLTRLLEFPENELLYNRLQEIIQQFIKEYKIEEKDGRYYIVKYPESLLTPWEGTGKNILRFWGGWDNYRVEVLNQTNFNSYHINPYASAVFYGLDTHESEIERFHSIDYTTGLLFSNKIHLIPDSSHAWNVVFNKKIDPLTLPKGFEIGDLDFNIAKCYRYRVSIEDDLIEKGIELANQLIKL